MTCSPSDIQVLHRALASLSRITGISFSLYDGRFEKLASSQREDPILAAVLAGKEGRDRYASFLHANLRLALRRKDPFMVQGLTGQYHFFFPFHYKGVSLVTVGEALYASREAFARFYHEEGSAYGLLQKDFEAWLKRAIIVPVDHLKPMMNDLDTMNENALISWYEKCNSLKHMQRHRTISSIMTNIKMNTPLQEIRKVIVETAVFLFNVNTAAVLTQREGSLCADIAVGHHQKAVTALRLHADDERFSDVVASGYALSLLDGHELRSIGLPEEITSLHLFPLSSEFGSFGHLALFNAHLDREAMGAVGELCRLSSYLLGIAQLGHEYARNLDELSLVSLKTSGLYFLYKDPESLYDRIVQEASSLVEAEKCSLMMPNGDKNKLGVSAAKGTDKWLMENVRVCKGEGIAGKVYEMGAPLLIDSAETMRKQALSPKARYKTFSSLSLPLKVADEIMGVLNLADKETGAAFTERDLALLTPFALQASFILKLSSCYKTSEEMRALTTTDFLTGLYNRRYFDLRLEEEYQRAKRTGQGFSLALIDIDDFKLFNDTEGHLEGDRLLRELATSMARTIRLNDILVRFGGEEFALIMPETSQTEAFHVVERVRGTAREIEATWRNFPRRHITVSAGIASTPDAGDAPEDLVRTADRALYQAKLHGKDRTHSWNNRDKGPGMPLSELGKNSEKKGWLRRVFLF